MKKNVLGEKISEFLDHYRTLLTKRNKRDSQLTRMNEKVINCRHRKERGEREEERKKRKKNVCSEMMRSRVSSCPWAISSRTG